MALTIRKKDSTPDRKPNLFPVFLLAFMALCLWSTNLAISLGRSDIISGWIGERGTFGDTFGAVNSLFTAFAFIGVVYSIILQRSQLNIAMEEMNKTKRILKKQQKNISKQNQNEALRSFETTFFQLFTSFTNLTETITCENIESTRDGRIRSTLRGKNAIDLIFQRFHYNVYGAYSSSIKKSKEDILKTYYTFLKENNHDLSHYFRTLYTLINFVETSTINNKHFYMKFIRAQLSNSEANLLFMNYISVHTTENFNQLVNNYGFLKNAVHDQRIIEELWYEVNPSAFGALSVLREGVDRLSSGSADNE